MIRISSVQIAFPGFSLGPVSLHVPKGEFFALMGPTGSGKTLLLESLAGLVSPHGGTIHFADRDVTYARPEERGIGLVYQDHALFPHMNVLQNVMFGQRYHGISGAGGESYARDLMDMLGLSHLATRMPAKLSGGEKQRVAMARALAFRPEIVLLDEPLSSLDPQFREGLRKQLKELHKATDTTFFMVTHDFVDALTLAESAAVIRKGNIEQSGSTLDIFHRPATPFIADFVGMKNCLPVQRCEGGAWMLNDVALPVGNMQHMGENGYIALRPEELYLAFDGEFPVDWVTLPGMVEDISRQGFSWLATVESGGATLVVQLEQRQALHGLAREGESVTLAFNPATAHYLKG
jgi:molybdate/tungstate transport system ATP-binding protein